MLVGVVTDLSDNKKELEDDLTGMTSLLRYQNNEVNKYLSFPIAVARIHIGAFDKVTQPHMFNVDQNNFALFFDGKILSVKGVEDENIGAKRDVKIIEKMLQEVPLGELLPRINGTFVGVLVNLTSKKITLFNDKHGTRYLFYSRWKNGLVFSSEVNAWKTIRGFEKKINWTAVMDFFKFGRVLSENTLVCGVKKMRNASIIEFNIETGRLSIAQYWDYEFKEEYENKDKEYFTKEFSRRISAATKRCFTRTSQTLGIGLSGGLDTRLILSAISPSDRRRVKCLTHGEEKSLEFKIAKKLARIKGVKHVCIPYIFDKIGLLIKDTVRLSDPGYCTPTVSYLPFVSEILSRKHGISIILTGVEGGETFGGRVFGHITRLNSHFGKYWKKCKGSLAESFERWSARSGFTNEELQELFKPVVHIIRNRAGDSIRFLNEKSTKAQTHIKNPINIADYLFLTPHPPNIAGTGVITRHWMQDIPVMFDDDLVDLYLEMPPEYRCLDFRIEALKKIDPTLAKVAWVETFVPVSTPHFITFFMRGLNIFIEKATLFLRIFSRGKIDLRKHIRIAYVDHDAFLRVHLRRYVGNILLDKKTLSRHFLNGTYVKKIVNDFLNFESVGVNKIARLLAFELWLRLFFDE